MKIAVVSPQRHKYSETFIRHHVDGLRAHADDVVHLYGDRVPLWRADGRALPPGVLSAVGAAAGRLLGRDGRRIASFLAGGVRSRCDLRERILAAHLQRAGVDVVLAEFGYTGSAMARVTARAGLPLVVYFLGHDAFDEAAADRPDARLVMAGDGRLREACRTLARSLGVEDRVRFPGAVAHDEVARLLGGARAFVQHSVRAPGGSAEGNPVVVREAMAAGLPVVATWHAGIAETVVHGETGLLAEEHDWRTMARHMAALLDDPDRAARMGRAGRGRAERHMGMEASLARLAEVLQAAAREGPPR